MPVLDQSVLKSLAPLNNMALANRCDADVGPGVGSVEGPVNMLLLDLPVINYDQPLHGIHDDRFIQVRTARCVPNPGPQCDIILPRGWQLRTLDTERVGVGHGLLAFDEGWATTKEYHPPAVGLARRFPEDCESYVHPLLSAF